jgi:hypothetical protein
VLDATVTAKRQAIPSRHWTFTCPNCKRSVRVNKDGTIAAHWPSEPGTSYCEGSREQAVYK